MGSETGAITDRVTKQISSFNSKLNFKLIFSSKLILTDGIFSRVAYQNRVHLKYEYGISK